MSNANSLDRKNLQKQLDNYKLIIVVNSDLEEERLFAKDELVKKVRLAQGYLDDADHWGKLGDQTKYHEALSNANILIVEISAEIRQVLNQDYYSDDSNLQAGQISG